jgi:hypothetical protein
MSLVECLWFQVSGFLVRLLTLPTLAPTPKGDCALLGKAKVKSKPVKSYVEYSRKYPIFKFSNQPIFKLKDCVECLWSNVFGFWVSGFNFLVTKIS